MPFDLSSSSRRRRRRCSPTSTNGFTKIFRSASVENAVTVSLGRQRLKYTLQEWDGREKNGFWVDNICVRSQTSYKRKTTGIGSKFGIANGFFFNETKIIFFFIYTYIFN